MIKDSSHYKNLFENFKDKKILIIGDLMIDRYYYGDVNRISPESPVPIVNIKHCYETLGGAGNVANNLIELGCNVYISGTIGNDSDGQIMKQLFAEKNIDYSGLIKTDNRTIAKTRIIGLNQQMMRLDFETTREIENVDEKKIISWFDKNINYSDCVVISDYAKGVCVETLCQYIIQKCNDNNIPIIIDPKGKNWSKYSLATVVTPNIKELSDIIGKNVNNDDENIEQVGQAIKNKFNIKNLLVTRSESGMSLISNSILHMPTQAREVYDVSGAGDTVISVLSAMIAVEEDIEDAVNIANLAAGIAVNHKGTYAVKKEEILNVLLGSHSSKKIVDGNSLLNTLSKLKEKGKKIVFTNGCFDILHRGHITYLRKAKNLGDILIVGLNADKSVKKLKGDERPINKENDRALMLSAFEFVDYVIIFDEETPKNLISIIKPDILVKGGDYDIKNVVGREYASETIIIPFVDGYSTTKIIESLK